MNVTVILKERPATETEAAALKAMKAAPREGTLIRLFLHEGGAVGRML
jgi:hypothetical protein